jgi:hypothetical protein
MIEAAPEDLVMRDGRIEIAGAPGSRATRRTCRRILGR